MGPDDINNILGVPTTRKQQMNRIHEDSAEHLSDQLPQAQNNIDSLDFV
jgi:hypothetical protein